MHERRVQQVEARGDADGRSAQPANAVEPARASCEGGTCSWGELPRSWSAAGCHGQLAMGDGPSFVSQDLFNEVVFGGNPSERQARLEAHLASSARGRGGEAEGALGCQARRLGQPASSGQSEPRQSTRAEGGRSTFSGGSPRGSTVRRCPRTTRRRFDDKKVWDLVNFVLALPYEPELLRDAPPAPAAPAALTAARERIALSGLREPPELLPAVRAETN